MPVAYNPGVLQDVADSLYSQAARVLVLYSIGGGVASFLAVSVALRTIGGNGGLSLLAFAVGVALGLVAGLGRAQQLRLQAQMLLCQAEACEHMRRAANCLGAYADG